MKLTLNQFKYCQERWKEIEEILKLDPQKGWLGLQTEQLILSVLTKMSNKA